MLDICTAVGVISVPKRSTLETPRRELSEDVSFGNATLLIVEQSSLEKRPREVWSYTGRIRYEHSDYLAYY